MNERRKERPDEEERPAVGGDPAETSTSEEGKQRQMAPDPEQVEEAEQDEERSPEA